MSDNQLLDKIETIGIRKRDYPFLLSQIPGPPKDLHYIGKLPKKREILIAVVGSRKCSAYGRQAAENIVYGLTREGIVIVSGLALGIDSEAHRAALKAKGKTVAVLGSGLDKIYPFSHRELAKEIVKNDGVLVSEFERGTSPLKHNFPLRNRIISGLCKATIVIEAAERSGALITAFSAIDQNREVFAIPGSIYSLNSQGANKLIRLGAHPVTKYEDVLKELNIESKAREKEEKEELNKNEQIVFPLPSNEPISIDKLRELSKLDIATLNATLITLEIKGLVKNIGGGQYTRIKN